MIRVSGLTALICLLLSVKGGHAQIPILPKQQKDTAPDASAKVSDPLGRSTPRGTITSFNQAVTKNDLATAARFLQLTRAQRPDADSLARDLSELMELYLSQVVSTISDSPEGARDDGLPPDRERVGPLIIGPRKIDIELVRVDDPFAGKIWLIASETISEVPALSGSITATWIETHMPAPLVERHLFGVSLAQWLGLAGSLVLPWLVISALSGVFIRVVKKRSDPQRRTLVEHWYAELHAPVTMLLTLMVHVSAMRFMGFDLTFRLRYGRLALVAFVVALAWLARRLLGVSFDRARTLMLGSTHSGTRSLMLLFERLIKALIVVVAVMSILTIIGVNTRTALAGIGIGGIAIALGAQKTVENLLGGIFLLTDKALAVGDSCTIGNRSGVVEDITLRSVRLRTPEQTVLSIPAGTLSQNNVENLSSRAKILIQSRLRLRYGTSPEQVRAVLLAIKRFMAMNEKLEQETARVRLVEFSDRAIELELFAYVMTYDNEQFLLVREELLLGVATIVESSGAGFAQPTQFVYMDREVDLDATVQGDARAGIRAEIPADVVSKGKALEETARRP